MPEPDDAGQWAPEQDDDSGEHARKRTQRKGQYEDALRVIKAVTALADLTGDPSSLDVLTEAGEDPHRPPDALLIVAVAASRLNTAYPSVDIVAQSWDATDAGASQLTADRLHELCDRVNERLSEQAADLLSGPWWRQATKRWKDNDFGRFAMAADEVRKWDHDLLQQFLEKAGLPDPVDAAIVFIVPLPFDKEMGELSKAIQVAGIFFAFATGHVVWACASLKALVHDEVIHAVAKVIRGEAASLLLDVGKAADPLSRADKADAIRLDRNLNALPTSDSHPSDLATPAEILRGTLASPRKTVRDDEAVDEASSGPTAVSGY